MNYRDGVALCATIGGTLLKPRSLEEFVYLRDNVRDRPSLWVDYRNGRRDGAYYWGDGTLVGKHLPWVLAPRTECLVLNDNMELNGLGCHELRYVICEVPGGPTEEPNTQMPTTEAPVSDASVNVRGSISDRLARVENRLEQMSNSIEEIRRMLL